MLVRHLWALSRQEANMTSSDADDVVAAAGLVAAIIVTWRCGFSLRIMS